MKLLNGRDIAEFIKERQLYAVRVLKQSDYIQPRLAIIRTNPSPIVDIYMKLKQKYGSDIGIAVDVHSISLAEAPTLIHNLNDDPSVSGIIVQLPLPDIKQTADIVNLVSPEKDVDGLGVNATLDPATPVAINWLLASYNIELIGKEIVVVGQGQLVGAPLTRMWRQSGLEVKTADITTKNLKELLFSADIIVTATGKPGLITSNMIKDGAVVVDAGVATDSNGLVGDLAPDVRTREDLKITPEKGGVGPLTVAALFENVLIAARTQKES